MPIFKCKMCGGTLEIVPGQSTAVCEYCGTQQTLPRLDDDRRANLYDRANHFRRSNEFDKAESIYEQILTDDTADAEAYWSLVLCRYGIEYVDDPATHKRVPTVNRAQFTSIFEDDNYKLALQYADPSQRAIYESEAAAINEIQKGILAISQKEQPFDVFICYKETDAAGRRTPDSVLANDLYYQLTQEGFRVFFSRITLEDKLGTAYEPYIFAALNSAKVMVVLGTRPEYFNAVWVKNEWSRYLALVKKSGGKKVLIPAYKDMDPYDLPDEFSHLQAQDMSKLGFMQDLIRGIKKLVASDAPKAAKETVVVEGSAVSIAPLLERAFMYLEDGDWENANAYCERVLDAEPKNAQAYLGKLMADLHCRKVENLQSQADTFEENGNYQKAMRFANEKQRAALTGAIQVIQERKEKARQAAEEAKLKSDYKSAVGAMDAAHTEYEYLEAVKAFEKLPGYEQADANAAKCRELAEVARKDEILANGIALQDKDTIVDLEAAVEKYESISGWKDTDERAHTCKELLRNLYAKREKDKISAKRRAKRNRIIMGACATLVIAVCFVIAKVVIPSNNYNNAVALQEGSAYWDAIQAFNSAGSYKDARERSLSLWTYIAQRNSIACGDYFTVGICNDNNVVAIGQNRSGQCDVTDWGDIIDISCGGSYTVGLHSDGTVVTTSSNLYEDISEWNDIVAIACGSFHTIGLKSDSTVVAAGNDDFGKCDISEWNDIVAVACGKYHTIGLKADGTVVATGLNRYGQCDTSEWNDIVSVACGDEYTVGLKSDGSVVTTWSNSYYDTSEWNDIVAVACGDFHAIGLKSDGTVVATGSNKHGQCNVSKWNDIVAVAGGADHTIGLKSDGTVVATGENEDRECNVSDWTNIRTSTYQN